MTRLESRDGPSLPDERADTIEPRFLLSPWNSRLKESRDLLLLISGGVYVFGYLARAFYSWTASLGVLPALDFQCFAAGVVLLTPIAALVGILLWIRMLLRRQVARELEDTTLALKINRRLIAAMVVGGAIYLVSKGITRLFVVTMTFSTTAGIFLLFASLFFFVGLALARPDPPSEGPSEGSSGRAVDDQAPAVSGNSRFVRIGVLLLQGFGMLMVSSIAVMAAGVVALACLVGLVLLPKVPQELGGMKPRCVTLDLDTRGLSPIISGQLVEASNLDGPHPIQRTRPLVLHYSNADFLLIQVPRIERPTAQLIELRRANVAASISCD